MSKKIVLLVKQLISATAQGADLRLVCRDAYRSIEGITPINLGAPLQMLSMSSADVARLTQGSVIEIAGPIDAYRSIPIDANEVLRRHRSPPRLTVRRNIRTSSIDQTENCVTIFTAAIAVAATKLHTKANLRITEAEAERKPVKREFTNKEVMDFSEDFLKELNAFRRCLTSKGAPEDLEGALYKKGQDLLKVLCKYAGERWKIHLKAHTQEMNEAIKRKQAASRGVNNMLNNQINAIEAQIEQLNISFADIHKAAVEAQKAVSVAFKGLTRLYAEIIKDSDGAAVMNPSVVKALENFSRTNDEKHLKTAKVELQAQLKKAKSGTKASKEFVDAMEAFIEAL